MRRIIALVRRHNITDFFSKAERKNKKPLGVLEGNYRLSTVGSPEIQTEMTTELGQAAVFCCLL